MDGCEGDLGYGTHSVPGGRTKNPEDYANFVESQKHIHQEDINMFDNHHMEASYEEDALNQDSAPAVTLHTGFSVPEPKELKLDVKPNKKIELRTGINDSPTLQATAREWAPSQATLAAAAAAAEKPVLSTSVDSIDGLKDDNDDNAPVSFVGVFLLYSRHQSFSHNPFSLGLALTLPSTWIPSCSRRLQSLSVGWILSILQLCRLNQHSRELLRAVTIFSHSNMAQPGDQTTPLGTMTGGCLLQVHLSAMIQKNHCCQLRSCPFLPTLGVEYQAWEEPP
jgi:hypothetical protein